jgi:hypothetical protein
VGWAGICYSELKNRLVEDDLASHLGDFTLADSKEALPLQAADLIAYEARRYAIEADGDDKAPVNTTYRRALRNIRSAEDFWLFDERRFTHLHRFIKRTVATG